MKIGEMELSELDLLAGKLRASFPEIEYVTPSADNGHFQIGISADTGPAAFMKALDAMVRPVVKQHGRADRGYYFTVEREQALLNVIAYNDDDNSYRTEVLIEGKLKQLYILDVLGTTGYYSVFDQDFQRLGEIYMKNADAPLVEGDLYDTPPLPRFEDGSLWAGSTALLDGLVSQIVENIYGNLGGDSGSLMLKVEEDDLAFWAGEFGVEETELSAAIEKVGGAISALEKYFDGMDQG